MFRFSPVNFVNRGRIKSVKAALAICRNFRCSIAEQQDVAGNQPSNEPPIVVEKDANITLIGINREVTRNSIDSAAAQKLCEVFHDFEADNDSPVAVLYGIGGSFCAGYDTQELERQVVDNSLDFVMRHEGAVGPTRRHLRKPVVCAINGFCVAGGIELALLCDLRVMEDTAVLGFFNRRLGVPLSDGGTVRLAASVGYGRALDLILSGRRVTGSEALQMGLVNRLVATGTALGQAVNVAFSVAKFPLASLQHDRSSMYANTFDRRGFNAATQTELMYTSNQLVDGIREGVFRFRTAAKGKGSRANSWNIKEKQIPDWEKVEIAHEVKKGKPV